MYFVYLYGNKKTKWIELERNNRKTPNCYRRRTHSVHSVH